MDRQKSILNVSTSILSRIVLLPIAICIRRLLIQNIGNDVNGLNSLYANIIGVLTVAELGIGRAIVYSMYKPILDGNTREVAALYGLYRRLYRIVGAVILVGGLAVIPFLPRLIHDHAALHEDVALTFFLTLISVTATYLYSAKSSLIQAHKNDYLTTLIGLAAELIRYGLQIAVLLTWKSFTLFLACQIIGTLFAWALTEAVARHKYPDILKRQETVDPEQRREITRNVKAMVLHKVGTILVNGIDNLIISGFIGVAVLGRYSNYSYVLSVMTGTISLFFTPLTSVIGHLCAEGKKEKTERAFHRLYHLNYVLGVVFFLGYAAVSDGLVQILFGNGLGVSRAIVFVMTINAFTQYMRRTALLFRNASGTFYHDRWKPIAEGLSNLVLSLVFVQVFPENLRVVGVIAATILTTMLICFVVEPYVVFKHVFGKAPMRFWLKNYAYIGFFTACLAGVVFLIPKTTGGVVGILLNGGISIGVSCAALAVLAAADQSFRGVIMDAGRRIRRRVRKDAAKAE